MGTFSPQALKRDDPNEACPNCNMPEEETLAPILLMGLGGMLLFFAFGFGIPGALGVSGFLWLAVGLALVGSLMVFSGWGLRSRQKKKKEQVREERMAKAKCDYCGSQNQVGGQKCDSCGAPLR
jgi:hypothetical protein